MSTMQIEPFAYVADWTKRRSTARLARDLASANRTECECDGYMGFTCGIHRRREELQWALHFRTSHGQSEEKK